MIDFLPRDATQSAVMLQYVACLPVRLWRSSKIFTHCLSRLNVKENKRNNILNAGMGWSRDKL